MWVLTICFLAPALIGLGCALLRKGRSPLFKLVLAGAASMLVATSLSLIFVLDVENFYDVADTLPYLLPLMLVAAGVSVLATLLGVAAQWCFSKYSR